MQPVKIMTIFGTRPEAIKMVPLIRELKNRDAFQTTVVVTAQHRQMLDQVLESCQIIPDYDLDIMVEGQTLSNITARVLRGLDRIFKEQRPDMVLVHGDTTTTLAASLAAFYHKILVGHVEAGLRTFDKYSPYPEEMNRKLTGCLSDLHFAPTENAKEHLLQEGIPREEIYVTGNTIVDILMQTVNTHYDFREESLRRLDCNKRCLLLTTHRRENIGAPMAGIFSAVREIAAAHNDVQIIFPIHLNQEIRKIAFGILKGEKNVLLTNPLGYEDMVNLMSRCYLILTDSGGIQEEAIALGKPVLVLRNTTERYEALACGGAKMIGTDKANITHEVNMLLNHDDRYRMMTGFQNPFGDGKASERIADILSEYFWQAPQT